MCRHQKEVFVDESKKIMLICLLKNDDNKHINLCIAQRYCSEQDKYVSHNQKQICKKYNN